MKEIEFSTLVAIRYVLFLRAAELTRRERFQISYSLNDLNFGTEEGANTPA